MKPSKAPKLREVAEESGVAVSTVSRILNRRANFSVREETRQRVLEAAARLNYRPDPITRAARARETKLISVLGLSDFGTSIRGATEESVNAMADRLFENGYELCTNLISPHQTPYTPPQWGLDGAIVVDCDDVELLEPLEEAAIPYVALNCKSGPNGSSVTLDDDGGAREVVRHLLALGHRRIAYIIPDEISRVHDSLTSRYEAYVNELTRCAIEPMTPEFPESKPAIDVIADAVLDRRATAVIAYHHVMAVKLLRAAATYGLRVPQDVSLVCFNDVSPCADLVPSLTAVSLPSTLMGHVAAETLIEQLTSDDPVPQHTSLKERLIIRESTAPPPSGPLPR